VDAKRRIFVVMAIVLLFGFIYLIRKQPISKMRGLIIVNVLDKELYDDCRIKGSINVAIDKIDTLESLAEKNAEIVLYCTNYMCSASGFARKRLLELGFRNVWVYEGGIAEWYNKGFSVEGPCEIADQRINVGFPEQQEGTISAEALKKKIDEFGG